MLFSLVSVTVFLLRFDSLGNQKRNSALGKKNPGPALGHTVVGIHSWEVEANTSVSSQGARADIQTNWCQANLRHDKKQILASQNYCFNLLRQEIKTRRFLGYYLEHKMKHNHYLISFNSSRNQGSKTVQYKFLCSQCTSQVGKNLHMPLKSMCPSRAKQLHFLEMRLFSRNGEFLLP